MKKLVYILLVVFLFPFGEAWRGFAQNLDSLWKVYNNTAQPDTNRVKAIDAIAWSYKSNKPDTAIILAKQELALAVALIGVEGQTKAGKNRSCLKASPNEAPLNIRSRININLSVM